MIIGYGFLTPHQETVSQRSVDPAEDLPELQVKAAVKRGP